jgi:hypothetical protein
MTNSNNERAARHSGSMASASSTIRPDWRVARWWLLAVGLAALAIGVVVYKAWPLLYPQTAERAPLNPYCDLRRSACTVQFESGGRVRLDIKPRGIPVVQPLAVEVELSALAPPERVELDFAGFDMDMGYNRVPLHPATVDGDPRILLYRGSAMLPICVRDRMTWEARVLLHRADGILAAPFRFETTQGQ